MRDENVGLDAQNSTGASENENPGMGASSSDGETNQHSTLPSPLEPEDNSDAERIGDQRNTMSKKRPMQSGDLNTGTSTSWIALMGLGYLACGFAQNAEQLFAFRSIAGVGGGGINSLHVVMIIVSDITTLKNRGKYQGKRSPTAALVSGALIIPIVITTSFTSILSGQYMSRPGFYMPCILVGFILWTVGNGLTLIFDENTGLGPLIGILIVEGAGIGLTLQSTLVGIYANSRSEDRAVTTGLRKFFRTIARAFGLVISGVILSNTLSKGLSSNPSMTDAMIAQLTSSTYALDELDISEEEKKDILQIYMDGLCVLLTALVGNTNLNPEKPSTGGVDDGETTTQEEQVERLGDEEMALRQPPNLVA
ncbi:hypothetical protein EDB80DRAFT_690592 [Ilyonectria destructans]|nr:hypothetical protein EDB80DRAFT_690592 [Ilyonectria destructans]